jgi:integrase
VKYAGNQPFDDLVLERMCFPYASEPQRAASQESGIAPRTGTASPAFDALKDEWMYHSKSHGFVFCQGQSWARKGMERLSRNAFNGKKHGHPHMLRHTLASMALLHFKPVWDIQFLAKWLGHEDIRTTYKICGHWIAQEPPSGYECIQNRAHMGNLGSIVSPKQDREGGGKS